MVSEETNILEKKIIDKLKGKFNGKRFKHIMGVVEVSEKLAIMEGVLPEKARLAALLHDYAKDLNYEELLEVIEKSDWSIDEEEVEIPELLHAPAAAFLAREDFGITDQEILEAIRYHTIGNPGMCLLAEIIYVADYIEPHRDFPGVESVREQSRRGLGPAIITICNNIIKYNIDRGRLIHPNTLALRNTYLRRQF